MSSHNKNLDLPNRFDVSGIDSVPRPIEPTSLVTAAMKESRVLMAGDTDHYNIEVLNLALSEPMLSAAKKGGATHIALEIDKGLQWRADQFMKDEISVDDLKKAIHMMYAEQQSNENGEFTNRIVDTAVFAKNNDMKIIFSDPHNGWGNKPSGLTPEQDEKWELENARDRFNDTELVDRLNKILQSDKDAKIYLTYGDAHFSVNNGNKESIIGPMTKLSLYSSRANLNGFENIMQNPDAHGRKMGWMEVKPDLVYFIEEKTFSTTNATSDEIKKAINAIPSEQANTSKQGFSSSAENHITTDCSLSKEFTCAATTNSSADKLGNATNPALSRTVSANDAFYLSRGTSGP